MKIKTKLILITVAAVMLPSAITHNIGYNSQKAGYSKIITQTSKSALDPLSRVFQLIYPIDSIEGSKLYSSKLGRLNAGMLVSEFGDSNVVASLLKFEDSNRKLVRQVTTLRDAEGNYLNNTVLDISQNKDVYKQLLSGQVYNDVVMIEGCTYLTQYTPIILEDEVVGAYFVGLPQTVVNNTVNSLLRRSSVYSVSIMCVCQIFFIALTLYLVLRLVKRLHMTELQLDAMSKQDYTTNLLAGIKLDKDEVGNMQRAAINLFNQSTEFLSNTYEVVDYLQGASADLDNVTSVLSTTYSDVSDAMRSVAEAATNLVDQSYSCQNNVKSLHEEIKNLSLISNDLNTASTNCNGAMQIGNNAILQFSDIIQRTKGNMDTLYADTKQVQGEIREMLNVIKSVKDINEEIDLLAVNTAIESSHLNSKASGISAIVKQIKMLSNNSKECTKTLNSTMKTLLDSTDKMSLSTEQVFEYIVQQQSALKNVSRDFDTITQCTRDVDANVHLILSASDNLSKVTNEMEAVASELQLTSESTAAVSEQTLASMENLFSTIDTIRDCSTKLTSFAGGSKSLIKDVKLGDIVK